MWIVLLISVGWLAGFLTLAWKKPGLAMALLPLTAIVPAIVGAARLDSYEHSPYDVVILSAGVALFILTIVLIYAKPPTDLADEPWYTIVSRLFYSFFVMLLYLALLIAIFRAYGPILFFLSLILAFRYRQTRRYSLALNVLSTLSTVMRQNLPLPMALETAGANRKDPAARIYRRTAALLCEGKSLSDALRRSYRRCPSEILATLQTGEALNQLPEAVAALEQDSIANISGFETVRPVHPSYPLIVGAVMLSVVVGLCVFILPTFVSVLHDMTGGNASLPASTQLLMTLAQPSMSLNIVVILFLILLAGQAAGFYASNRSRRPERPRLMSRAGDWLKWHLPVLCHFERLRSQQRAIQGLRTGLRGGYSFDVIVRQMLGLDVNLCYRAQLRRWQEKIEQGYPVAASAVECGLGRTLAWALDETVNKGNTPQLLAMLEEVTRNRYHYRLNIFHSILWPFVVVGMGGCVGFVVYALFAAIVSLITYTMDY